MPKQTTATYDPATKTLTIHLRGLGHVPGFKNRKRICGKRLVTDEKAKAWMNAAVLAIRAALVSCSPISASETSTTAGGRSRTFLSVLPADDRWTCLAEERNTGELCAAGDEGAVVEVRMLT